MTYVERSSEGFFSKLGNSIAGIFFGIILIVVSCALLYWNEGRYVRTAAGIAEGKGSVQEIKEDKVDPAMEGKLVHLTGNTKAGSALKDELFGVKAKAIRLSRQVQYYEWVEEKETKKRKKLGGGEETITTYTYDKKWVDSHQDSSGYKEKGHDNPAPPADVSSTVINSTDSTIGAFKLQDPVLKEVDSYTALPLKDLSLPEDRDFELKDGVIYDGQNPSSPNVGDVKVQYQVVEPGQLSLVAKQVGNSFDTYVTKNGTSILYVRSGAHTAAEMFTQAESSNSTLVWILRVVGWVLMCIGFSMLLGPIAAVANIIPFLGDLVEMGTGLFGCATGTALTLICIAIGWIFARPLVGIAMLLAAFGFFFLLKKMGGKK
ncbi:TMEM43 family protein [bacterium]|nr:TMEM43 family protein [bacterium]